MNGLAQTVMSGSLLLAVLIAMLAGLISFLSPCCLPLVPGYLSYVTGLTGAELAREHSPVQRDLAAGSGPDTGSGGTLLTRPPQRSRVLAGSVLFVAGFSAVFMSYGVLFGGLGSLLLEHATWIQRVLGAIVILMGLAFAGFLPFAQRDLRIHRVPTLGLAGAPLLGVLFGLGWTPCIGPTLAAVQTLAFTEASAARGAILSAAYSLGLGLPFILIGVTFRRAAGAMSFFRRHTVVIMRIGGISMAVIGLLLLTGQWDEITIQLRIWSSAFTPGI